MCFSFSVGLAVLSFSFASFYTGGLWFCGYSYTRFVVFFRFVCLNWKLWMSGVMSHCSTMWSTCLHMLVPTVCVFSFVFLVGGLSNTVLYSCIESVRKSQHRKWSISNEWEPLAWNISYGPQTFGWLHRFQPENELGYLNYWSWDKHFVPALRAFCILGTGPNRDNIKNQKHVQTITNDCKTIELRLITWNL